MIRFSLYNFVYFLSFAVIAPYLQVFLRTRGFDVSQVGLLLACFALAGAAGSIGVGHLGDRLGKRRTLLAAAMVASMALMIPLAWISSFWVAVPIMALFGIAHKATIPLGDALAGAELPDPTRQYGRVRTCGSVGFLVGIGLFLVLGVLDESSSTSILLCFLVAAALAIPVILTLPDSHRRSETPRFTADAAKGFDRAFWLILVIVFMAQLGMAGFYSFFTQYLGDVIGIDGRARIWGIGVLAELPLIFFAGPIIRRFGVVRVMAFSLIAIAARLALYGTFTNLWVISTVTLLHGFCFILPHAAVMEFIGRKIPRANRGLAMTLYMAIAVGIAPMVGSAGGGYIVKHISYRAMFYTLAAAPIIGLGILMVNRRRLTVGR
jgi:PPP family 3-phenylpropionic acid transporter